MTYRKGWVSVMYDAVTYAEMHTDQPLASNTRVCTLCRDLLATYFKSTVVENKGCYTMLQIAFMDERCADRRFEEREKHTRKNLGERSMTR